MYITVNKRFKAVESVDFYLFFKLKVGPMLI